MAKHRIVFVSKDDKFSFDRKTSAAVQEQNPNLEFCYVAHNVQPLADVYNSFLQAAGSDEWDFTYFTHADVLLDFVALVQHVERAADKYDVMGLCGCEKFNVSVSPLNWFNGSRPFPPSRWGCVTHGELGDATSFFNMASPDTEDKEVACIDGLCIIFSKKAVQAGLRFDRSVGDFDCYDTDISM